MVNQQATIMLAHLVRGLDRHQKMTLSSRRLPPPKRPAPPPEVNRTGQRSRPVVVMTTTTDSTHSSTEANARIDQLEQKVVLASLWTFALLTFFLRDLHEIVKADFLADALRGVYSGREVTDVMFLLGGLMVQIPILMVPMSLTLRPRMNRWANLIVAPFFGLTVVGAAGDLDDYLHFGMILAALAVIIWRVWYWKPAPP